jgi:hypothetical protein
VVSINEYDTLDDLMQANQANICESSNEDSDWCDDGGDHLDDIPDLLSEGDDSSADDSGDDGGEWSDEEVDAGIHSNPMQ